MRLSLLVVLSVLVLTQPLATTVNQELSMIKSQLKQVGEAKFSVLFWDIYHSELFSKTGSFNSEFQDVLFEIQYLKNIKRDELIERTVEQWQHIGAEEQQYRDYVALLKSIWPNIKKGDKLSLYITENRSQFFFNGNDVGAIEDDNFGPLFLSIWLSEKTSQPELRVRLLGGKNV